MPRAKVPPAYRLHKARKCGVVTIDGRDHYLGPYGSTESRRKYAALIHQWEQQHISRQPGTRPRPVNDPELTVGELILAYWGHVNAYYVKAGRVTTEVENIRQALKPLRILHESTRVADFGPLALRDVRDLMVEGWEFKTSKGAVRRTSRCRGTINKDIKRIRQLFRWGVEHELVPPSILEGLRAVAPLRRGRTTARESKRVRSVDLRHVVRTLRFLSPQVKAMVRLQYLCGARPSEICILRPMDVLQRPDGWEYVPATHKNEHRDQARVIYFGPKAQRVLQPWLERRPDAYCFSPREAEVDRNQRKRRSRRSPMTPSQRSRNERSKSCSHVSDFYDEKAYARAIRRAARKACVPIWSPNQLRHSRATRIRAQYGLEASTAVLGHADINTTLIYAEQSRRLAANVMREVG